MKPFFFTAMLLALMTLGGCEDDGGVPGSHLTITFKAVYDGQPLEMYKNYDYDTYRVFFTRFNTYLSEFYLRKGTELIRISDNEWVDFTPTGASNLALEVPVVIENVPEGDYTGIRFGYGVSPDLNAKQPKDFPAGHPLSLENEYWLGWKSYIFNKIEGKADLNNDGTPEGNLVYHCGSDAVYRTGEFALPITIEPGAKLPVTFDLKRLFDHAGPAGGWLDLNDPYNQLTSNETTDVVIATLLMNQIDDAITVEQK